MNKIKISILTIFILSAFIFSKEKDEIKTINKDGIIYQINSASKNMKSLTTLPSKTKNDRKLKASGYKLYTSFGHFSPLGENIRGGFDPGYSIGAILETRESFMLFMKEWTVSVSGKYSNLPAKDESGYNNFAMMDLMTHLSTDFGPIIFNLGVGLTRTNSISPDISIDETHLPGSANIGYKIIAKLEFDLIYNLNLRYTTGGPLNSLGNASGSTS